MWVYKFIYLCLWILIEIFCFTDGLQEMSCCSVADGECRTACSEISLVAVGADSEVRESVRTRLTDFCSHDMSEFWACVNSTLSEAENNENWVGRGCCHLAQYPLCQSSCALAGSRMHLENSCRPSDELEFYSCLERREEGESCCSDVSNTTCRSVCRDLFHKPGKQFSLKLYSSKGCFTQVPKCLKTVAESANPENPKQYLNCCKEATTPDCLDACRKVLFKSSSIREILDTLEEKCHPVIPHSPLWSCILQTAPIKPSRVPLDIGKLTCCSRAASTNCQNLCWKAFQADWEVSWSQMETECLSSPNEADLRRCIEDSDEPCEIGCTGLSYCTKFNNRPVNLFRSCSKSADDAARWEADHWARGGVIRGLGVPVRADPSCPLESLRAAACVLQLRPCENRIHETQLCREDCLELMANCVDWTVIGRTHTAASLCAKLSPSRPGTPCVSLRPFMEEAQDEVVAGVLPSADVSTPCKRNPCPDDQVCVLTPNDSTLYKCLPSCTLGEMSRLLVPLNTWVQIPRTDQQGCHHVCQCTANGLEKCKTLNCYNPNSCWVQDRFVAHRTNFYLDCNPCHCFEGEVTCSRKTCSEVRVPSLPCDCPAHYVPVCSRFGVTYASACLAKCTGLSATEIQFGSCSSVDPCQPNPCNPNERCLRKPRVCLSPIHKPCRQYECVPLDCDLRNAQYGPVCDRDNRQHNTSCALIKAKAALAYHGPCLRGCSLRGPICAVNGEVYASECAAWADRTIVDYVGACVAVGVVGDRNIPRCGDAVKCPRLNPSNCIGVTPPGSCCPVCGGAARIFYSKKQLDRIYYMMDEEADKDAVTLEKLLLALGRQIQVAQCTLRGHVTPENDIFIIVQSTAKEPSSLQLRACIAETEKLVVRITERSSKVVAEVPLGSLTRAEVAHGHVSMATGAISSLYVTIVLFAIIKLIA
ncbi:GSCOCG00006956001-RA-CDS [Cotesia congregata]|uniref:Similar to RECK: Reversion-inducing cysteine-rich protein with Kazal motifs (Homo sapiens) n=1 Tax=Cotesia congregata TaxID=51543 RepID=A0A8J2HE42_COTCN|nr:GSCOCG00006956001-RA-CDS [Cotesia congregata]CAG5092646.1 Similar to RECK: Reversion-inducing cysteine-rich protein with Kazal motifs (Homo sapiens) [Cotesia congregata]